MAAGQIDGVVDLREHLFPLGIADEQLAAVRHHHALVLERLEDGMILGDDVGVGDELGHGGGGGTLGYELRLCREVLGLLGERGVVLRLRLLP